MKRGLPQMAKKGCGLGLFGILVLLLVSLGCAPQKIPQGFKMLKIDDHEFVVEVADTPEKHSKGLGERDNMPRNQGMLFIFPADARYALWMKGMRFPLDFIWISSDKTIVEIAHRVPTEPGKPDSLLKIYTPGRPALYILEVNSGLAKYYNLKLGGKVEF